jgi:hypothetical protein
MNGRELWVRGPHAEMAEYPLGQNRRENRKCVHIAAFDIGALVESELDRAITIPAQFTSSLRE